MKDPFQAIPPLLDDAPTPPTSSPAAGEDALKPNPVPRNLLANVNQYGVPVALLVALVWLCWPDPPKKHPLPAASSPVDPERIARESSLATEALKAAANGDTPIATGTVFSQPGSLSGTGKSVLPQDARKSLPWPDAVTGGSKGYGVDLANSGHPLQPAQLASRTMPIRTTGTHAAEADAMEAQANRQKRAEEVRAAPIEADGSVRLLGDEPGKVDGNAGPLVSPGLSLEQELRSLDLQKQAALKESGVLVPPETSAVADPQALGKAGSPVRHSNTAFLNDKASQQSGGTGNQPRFLEPDPAPDGPVLLQGTLIEATLNTAIDSSLPGDVLATVSRDVYDSVHSRHILIPAGSRLIGQYNPEVHPGQERILLAMQRLILPDGSAISLSGAPALDLQGKSGVPGKVNDHFLKRFGSSLVLGAVSLLLPGSQSGSSSTNQSGSVVTSGSVAATALTDTVHQSLERNRVIGPTLEQGAGLRFVFVVGRDMRLPPWQDLRQRTWREADQKSAR